MGPTAADRGAGTAQVDASAWRRRFVDGFAGVLDLDPALIDRPGTSVLTRADRAGTGVVACYCVGRRLVLWADPALDGVLGDIRLASAGRSVADIDEVDALLADAGFVPVSRGEICVLDQRSPVPPPPGPYTLRQLSADEPDHVDAIRAFVAGCDPAEVTAAGLDDLDDFDEVAVNVIVDNGSGADAIVAYSSAMDWAWDPVFGDLAALVHVDHRRRGLAAVVVAAAIDDLLTLGRAPLYRYSTDNLASARLAAVLGFRPVARFTIHQLAARS